MGGLTDEQVEKGFLASPGEKVLVSRRKSGKEAKLGDTKIEAGLQVKIDRLNEQGYQIIMLLCTGEFHSLSSEKAMLIEPDRVIPAALAEIVANKQLGVIVPAEEQIKEQLSKWKQLRKPPVCTAASPYSASEQEVIKAGQEVQAMGADVVILDCIGYNETHLKWLQGALDIPVLLSNRFIAGIVGQFI